MSAEVADLLTDSVSSAIESEAESQAKEMIDRLLVDLESEISPATVDSAEDTESSESPISSTDASKTYRVELAENGDIEERFEDAVQSDLMAAVVNYLLRSHDLVSDLTPLPYIPGKKRAIIHDEPTYNGTEMAQPRELEDGQYVELNLNWDQKKREIRRMANMCGLEVTIESPENK